ncbi:MAG: hypothetical protein VB064_00185 [Oscillospiraceae bacterium]|nr:hypothetical protein [Oscillospiraceae bacterium]
MKKQIARAKRFNYTVFVIILIIATFIGIWAIKYKLQHEFSPSRWADNPSERVEMVDDMLDENELKGMTKEEITSLLGETSSAEGPVEGDVMSYYLGVERGLTSDGEWLIIYFTDGRASDYKVTFG